MLTKFVTAFHILVIAVVLLFPFINLNITLVSHSLIVPCIFLHWITNNNLCVLTYLEKTLKGNNLTCFTCKFIEPVYDITKGDNMWILYFFVTALWVTSVKNLYIRYKQGKIKSFYDLFNYQL